MVRWLVVLGAVLAGSACARHKTGATEPDRRPVQIEVNNQFGLAMEVYVVGTGARYSLGTVHPGTVAQFTVPQNIIGSGSVELQAQPNASNQLARSGPLLLSPGAVVDFLITPRLFNSFATVRQ